MLYNSTTAVVAQLQRPSTSTSMSIDLLGVCITAACVACCCVHKSTAVSLLTRMVSNSFPGYNYCLLCCCCCPSSPCLLCVDSRVKIVVQPILYHFRAHLPQSGTSSKEATQQRCLLQENLSWGARMIYIILSQGRRTSVQTHYVLLRTNRKEMHVTCYARYMTCH